ncbi:efflux transporter outer membrane subunit [Sphingomonas sp. CGMCC 1.13654]|uniref:Efflux transporter outer membrane subunit n=1 Tax=Sphingomonas chungangi TaxID=2683589 RepID=A0A838L075_9SPHN|nr:efflux transporter outer membrane subunit [Sphingomonas chungangi]MBA2932614.1 efflux transporter outer membrane subunit [Sphingomonas chungangi]MVW56237.1 efflux transporter outer membrane subunit [Sphingomonas chungangi]
MKTIRPASALVVSALLAGCTVGPNYSGPPVAAPKAAKAPAFVRAGDAPVAATPPVARWWESLNDTTLTALENRALSANPDLAAAEAKLRQARASLREQKANLLPKGSASALYAHARFPGLDLGSSDSGSGQGGSGSVSDIDLYNLGFDASWEVDIFGGQRRAIEAARATAEGAEASLADAQVSLTAEVAQAYINVRDRQRRIALNQQSIAMQEQMLALTRQRFERGTASRLDVERLSQQLDSTRADVTPLHAELDAYLDELATLTGDEPGALDATMATPAPLPLPPAEVAIGDPAGLLQRRPDIRAAERMLAADTAKIGQAKAAEFPSLSFMGIIGIGGTSPADLTKLDDFTALLAPQLSWSFLDFGRNAAKVKQAEGVRDEAEAKYRSAVLAALRDAEDSLSQFRNRRGTVATLARAKASADETLALSRQRYAAGTSTLIDLLDAERQQVEAEQNLSIAEAGLSGDFVTIQKALGLGWGATEAPR